MGIKQKLLVVDENSYVGTEGYTGADSYIGTEICIVGELTDQELLLAMAETFSSDEIRGTTVNRLQAVLAETILTLNIDNGSQLVLSLSALVFRNMRKFSNMRKKEDETSTEDPLKGTLVELRAKMRAAVQPSERMAIGLELGDQALHYHAGFRPRELKRVFDDRSAKNYSRRMSLMGYESSQSIASYINSPRSRSVSQLVPPLINRFQEASTILSALIGKEDDEVRSLIGVLN